jgi:signal transduction histidine kinase
MTLAIVDNGSGFDLAEVSGGMGLQTMRDRVAQLGGRTRILAAPGQGTEIRVELGLKNGQEEGDGT